MLQRCWNLLPENEKWRLRDQEALPKKGAPVNLEENDAQKGGRNKGKPDGRKLEKEEVVSSLREQISTMVK